MLFGPRPKTMAAWLSSASCRLGRQRDIGAVVDIGQAFGVRFWHLPVFPFHQPSSRAFMALGHISSVILFLPSCWFVLLGNNSTARRGGLRQHERGISCLVGNPPNKAADPCRLLSPPSHQGDPHFWGEAGDTIPHLSPQPPPPCDFSRGGANRARRCGPAAALTLRSHPALAKARAGKLVLVLFQLPSPHWGWLHQETCLEVRTPPEEFWTPVASEGSPSSQTKTQERFTMVLAWVDKTSAWICSVMTGLRMRACSYKLNKTFSDLSHIMACLLIPLPGPETSGQIYNREIFYCPPQQYVSGASRLVSRIETESIYLSPLTILTLGECHLRGVILKQSCARGVRRSLLALLFFTQDWSNLSSNSSQSPHPVCVFPEFFLMECIFPVERTEEFGGKI